MVCWAWLQIGKMVVLSRCCRTPWAVSKIGKTLNPFQVLCGKTGLWRKCSAGKVDLPLGLWVSVWDSSVENFRQGSTDSPGIRIQDTSTPARICSQDMKMSVLLYTGMYYCLEKCTVKTNRNRKIMKRRFEPRLINQQASNTPYSPSVNMFPCHAVITKLLTYHSVVNGVIQKNLPYFPLFLCTRVEFCIKNSVQKWGSQSPDAILPSCVAMQYCHAAF